CWSLGRLVLECCRLERGKAAAFRLQVELLSGVAGDRSDELGGFNFEEDKLCSRRDAADFFYLDGKHIERACPLRSLIEERHVAGWHQQASRAGRRFLRGELDRDSAQLVEGQMVLRV